MRYEEFEATKQAREWKGEDYAQYIQSKLAEDIDKGVRTLEEARALSLGSLFVGNDGD